MKKTKKIIRIICYFIFIFAIVNQCNYQVEAEATKQEEKGIFYIDTQFNCKTFEGSTVLISGWIMTEAKDTTLKIYIDGQDTKIDISKRIERPDVIENIHGYGESQNNPKPGFETTLDISNYTKGKHTVKYQLEKANGKILYSETYEVMFNNEVKGTFDIDSPNIYGNIPIIKDNQLQIRGWIMTNDINSQLSLYIDGKKQELGTIIRIKRNDVIEAIKGYGDQKLNPKPGFETTIDLSNISQGKHQVVYKLETKEGKTIAEKKATIEIKKGEFYIDTQFNCKKYEDKSIFVSGWVMTSDPTSQMKIYIDGQDTKTDFSKRIQRNDVITAVKGYGGKTKNPTPGFEAILDIGLYQDGEHTVTYSLEQADGTRIYSEDYKVNFQKQIKGTFDIDIPNPYKGINQIEGNTLKIDGWIMSNDIEAKLKIMIDGNEVKILKENRIPRQDVLNSISGYNKKINSQPGFEMEVDISNISAGEHEIIYQLKAFNGEILMQKKSKIVRDNTKKAMIEIDTPDWKGVENIDGKITGWIMTNIENPKIRVFIDQYERWDSQTRVERPDVLEAIKGYGGESLNPKPGFVINMKYGDFSIGTHTLKIIVEDQERKQIAVKTKQFEIYKSYQIEEGSFGFSGLKVKGEENGTDLKYYKIGDGPNVFYATFAIHGFEDKWNRDGKELTLIAEEFKNRLIRDKDRSILSKWTIYIFPQINTDGVNHGWSNNGPGRKTLYSWAPQNEGIDMNRCWQTGSFVPYTGRNYNGTGWFQAYEAGYLKDFLLRNKATNGQTVLIDLHGWTTQLIGDYGISKECYAPYFPENRYTNSYGTGYLINWARSSLGSNGRPARSALIELPEAGINSHQDVVNAGYANRYIEATLYMLRVLV